MGARLSAAARCAGATLALVAIAVGRANAQPERVIAPPSCSQSVAQSRMLCLTASNCQREISPVLRACSVGTTPACEAAREDLRRHCSRPSVWYGTRECDAAMDQVRHYCER